MKFIKQIKNSFSVKIAKALKNHIPYKLIWLQDIIIDDLYGSLINNRIKDVELFEAFENEYFIFPEKSTFKMHNLNGKSYLAIYIAKVKNAFISPITGLCWRKNEYFSQSVGSVSTCFGYRTAFKQIKKPRQNRIIENAIAIVNTNNISHFLFEDLPGIIKIHEQIDKITIIIKKNALDCIKEILNTFFTPKLEIIETNDTVLAKYCYFLTKSDEQPFLRKGYIDIVRNFVLNKIDIVKSDLRKANSFIYISRVRSKIRAIENEKDVERALKLEGFEIVYLEELTFSDQVSKIASANIIIGMHGAGMTHLLWATKCELVIEIFPIGYDNSIFEALANSLELNYKRLNCRKSDTNKFGSVEIVKLLKLLNH